MIWNKRITLMAIGIILFILLVITLKHFIGPIELSRGNEEGFIGEIYGEKNISLKINDSVIYPYGDTFLGIDVLGKRQEYLLLKINNHYVGLGEDSSVMIDGWIVTYKYCRNDTYHFFVGFKPNLSVSYVTQLFRGYSAYRLFREFPWLGKMWLNSYGIQTRVRAKGSATSSERDPNFALSVTERAVMSLPSDITLPRGL